MALACLVLALCAAGGLSRLLHRAPEPAPAEIEGVAFPVPPAPPRLGGGAGYNQCLDLIESDPQGALLFARGLSGNAALHCEGLAQIELGSPDIGAPILLQIGNDPHEEASVRAAILGQASRGFLMIDNNEQARGATQAALALLPDDPDLRFDDAIAAIAISDFAGAIADLEVTLAADPKNAEALVARATSYRETGKLDLARADADAAVALDPADQDALLERGIIRQREGDAAGARADWQHVQTIDPGSNSADLATQNLALLDAAGT